MKIKIIALFKMQIVRFFLVAGVNTFFGYGVFAVLIYIGLHYSLAVLISTIIGILINFKTYGYLVFNSKKNRLIFRFIGVYAIVYLCYIGGIAIFEYYSISNYTAGMIMAIPLGFLGFILNNNFVYKPK
jgi:putative flippase GtrA